MSSKSIKVLRALSMAALSALPVLAQDGGESAPPSLFGGNFLFIMVSMMAIIYFLMIRPEKKRQKERQNMLAALKKGDKVVTIGGVVGVITDVRDTTYVVKTGEGASIEFTKSSIQSLTVDAKDQGSK